MDDKTVIRFPNDNTIIKPRPGGKRFPNTDQNVTRIAYNNIARGTQSSQQKQLQHHHSFRDVLSNPENIFYDHEHSSTPRENNYNNILKNATILLSITIKLSNSIVHKDVSNLKYKLQDEIKSFEVNASRAGIANDKIIQARYVICTTLDEIVSCTPWGQDSDWSQQSLLSIFHGETWGGEKFFLLLERLLREPIKSMDILELMYICMSIGFQGKYRIIDNGYQQLEYLREDLFRQLRSYKIDYHKELSSNWRGAVDRRGTLIRYVPLWVVGALSGVVLLATFSSFTYILDQSATPVIDKIYKLGVNFKTEEHQGMRFDDKPEKQIPIQKTKSLDRPTIYQDSSNIIKTKYMIFVDKNRGL